MLERQERTALLLLAAVAVVVIAAHGILAGLGKQPFARPFTTSSADGDLVIVVGQIDRITLTGNGGHMILEVNDLPVFLPAEVVRQISLQKGERIQVYGIVQTYRGKKEIVVDSAADILIIPTMPPV